MGERRAQRFWGFLATIVVAVSGVIVAPLASADSAEAAVAGEFSPGYIISDEIFFNSNAMTPQQIQAFLESQVSRCVAARGVDCLRSWRGASSDRPAQAAGHCTAYAGSPAESASMLIWRVAQACRINPQVLLVTLQKEQGLITQPSPSEAQYRIAMGFGCPDTAPCDTQYYGFFNQVYKAAWQLRQYTFRPSQWRYRVGAVGVQFHPNAACGSSVVQILNQATANLYNYTPYQPNGAAMANLGGSGDGCSSYGNRNFWRYFTDWFGPTASGGPIRINEAHLAFGGDAGPLGAATSPVLGISENGGGLGRAFHNGSIYWTASTGAQIVMGAMRDYYFSLGGAAGALGWPSSMSGIVAGGTGSGQAFTGGSVYSSNAGTFLVYEPVRSRYFLSGGASGWLGFPTAEMACTTARESCSQSFANGSVVWTAATGSRSVHPAIEAALRTAGGSGGILGQYASDVVTIPQNGGGVGQAFNGGSIYAGPAGAWVVRAAVRDFYFSLGGAAGPLGWPTGVETCGLAGSGCSQPFQAGVVYWSAGTGARALPAAINTFYTGAGGPAGALGYPLSAAIDIVPNGGGSGQAFVGGSVYSSRSGTWAVSGAVRDHYFSYGGSAGSLGWPTGAQTCGLPSGGCSQQFQQGTIYWSPVSGARVVPVAINVAYVAAGGAGGSLGYPTSSAIGIPENAGGVGQAFSGGSIYAGQFGTWPVRGPIRDFYFGIGGASGALGWPTSGQICTADNRCSQSFQGGIVDWSAETGARPR